MSVVGTSVVGGKLGLNMSVTGVLDATREMTAYASRLPTIQKRAILSLRRKLPVQARRDIQAEYAISASRIRSDLGTSLLPDGIRLTGHFRGIGLRNYGARQTSGGVSASILRGKRTLRPGAFMAKLLSGNVQAVHREGEKRVMKSGRYVGKKRQPLVVEYGPTAAQMLRKGRRPERLLEFSRGVLRSEIDRQLKSLASKSKDAT